MSIGPDDSHISYLPLAHVMERVIQVHTYIHIYTHNGKNICQGGKPDTGKLHSFSIGMNVCGSEWVRGQWHVCYSSRLYAVTNVTQVVLSQDNTRML